MSPRTLPRPAAATGVLIEPAIRGSAIRSRSELLRRVGQSNRLRLERMLWEAMAHAGLPEPEKEWLFALSIGRRYRADGFIAPDLLLEVEGGIWAKSAGRHNRGSGFEADAEKYNLAAILGFRVLRFTERMIRTGVAVEHIRRALEARASA